MGGKNAMIVLKDANVDLAVDGAVWGGFGTTGQRCTASSRVIVQKSIYDEFVDKFLDRVRKLKVGNGLDETTEMGPQINEQQLQTAQKYVEIGKNEGAKLLYGGHRLNGGAFSPRWFHWPAAVRDMQAAMRHPRGAKLAAAVGGRL